MARFTTDDGVDLFYTQAGEGTAIVFVHEFGGDYRSFEPQMRHFCRLYHCIAFNARGYPPSAVPASVERYSQERARDDILAVLNALKVEMAHIVGVSMGSLAALHFAISYPERTLSVSLGGCGSGAQPKQVKRYRADILKFAKRIEAEGMNMAAMEYGTRPNRLPFLMKDPRGHAEFMRRLKRHSTLGSVNTLRGVQSRRQSVFDMAGELATSQVPTLIMSGDEDLSCLESSLFLKRAIRSSALVLLPNTGHTLNLEEPDLYNQLHSNFFHQVEASHWSIRVPRCAE